MDIKQTVLAFVECINQHDVDGIVDLMSDDYTFINSANDVFHDKEFMRDTWRAQFKQHPDFHIRVDHVISENGAVAIFGLASGTYSPDGEINEQNHWETSTAFLGIARNGKMTHWQVFSDTSMVFDLMKAND